MSTDTAYAAVRAYLEANFTGCPMAFENEPFDRPQANGKSQAWMLVEISSAVYGQASIGSGTTGNLWRETGLIWGHVFVPTKTGSLKARQLAHQFVDLFRSLLLNGGAIKFGDASIGRGEPGDDDGLYWRLSVTIDYTADFSS
jgi:hypothetical protein